MEGQAEAEVGEEEAVTTVAAAAAAAAKATFAAMAVAVDGPCSAVAAAVFSQPPARRIP